MQITRPGSVKRIFVILIVTICISVSTARAATEFICEIRESGGDFNTVSSWESAINCDLTHSTGTRVFPHGGITGAIPDNSTLTGENSGATGVATHVTSTQVLLKDIIGTFSSGEQVYLTQGVDYITVSDAGAGAIAVAKIDGTWSSAEGVLYINDWSTSGENYIKIYTTGTARHRQEKTTLKYIPQARQDTRVCGVLLHTEYQRLQAIMEL
jgi:hypothetical protein